MLALVAGALALAESGLWTWAYEAVHPPSFHWPDRRPIGSLFLARASPGWTGNPRGWFGAGDLDIASGPGRGQFRQRLQGLAEACIGNLRAANAQGIIIWDLEGEQYPHPSGSFVGDPTNLKRIAPEMDEVADDFLRRFRDAGFRVGLCIRPQSLSFRSDGSFRQHEPVLDATALYRELDRKIRYAENRWACTLFYVDSNFGFQNLGLHWVGIFRRLHAAHPGALLIPEHGSCAYLGVSAPYTSLQAGRSWVGRFFSADGCGASRFHGFRVINVADTPAAALPALARQVAGGDVLLFRAWVGGQDLALVQAAYGRAGGWP